ncbi:DNA repair exonuclease SbcCD nuclease subunit [Sphingomonas aquatilis]|uniref:DNA repair exonuclease SbcCD nuclease subunit n=2 Tax=Sphingomonas aquatilis TaxID=93063 RepID=A0AAW3TR26_9SPHN|nr:metallophosphoesterase [Sphingomonas aquatilis]MBB3874991.1 DNA repair exonuclease SbcCD nuclease subunit [Sphingomonas aquatilis]
MPALKIVHTADWQLGKPFGRFPVDVANALSEARLDAIDRLGSVASAHGARHVFVAGDVFDNVDPGDRIVGQALSRMERAAVTWWLMPGNHDHARPGGLWSRVRRLAPPNVRIVDEPAALEIEEGAWLLPAPLEHRKTVSDPSAGMGDMTTPSGALRIGMAHGSIAEFGASGGGSNLIPPDRARSAGLDYLALGDWHGFLKVGDRTAYSGTPEVDRFGREDLGACAFVDVRTGDAPIIERIETGRYRWLTREWEVRTAEEVESRIAAMRSEARLSDVLLNLRLTGVASLAERVAAISALEGRFLHELRHLDVDMSGLAARPTDEDVARIDVRGALASAAATLQARATGGGPDAATAAAALERLYVEAMRYEGESNR